MSKGFTGTQGTASPYFITDEEKQEVRLDGPMILISDLRLTEASDLVPLMDRLVAAGCPGLLVIADEVSGSALGLLVANHREGILRSVAVRAPGQAEVRARILEDLAVLTGGRVVTTAGGEQATNLTMDDLGRANHVWANSDNFGVYGGDSEPAALRRRIKEVRAELAATAKPDEGDVIRRRLGKLMGGVAILYVGGTSENEQRTRKELAKRTVTALRLALGSGVVPGGGAAYLGCRQALRGTAESVEEVAAFHALEEALQEPLAVIAANAGFDPHTTVADVAEGGGWRGFDAETGELVDAWDSGIVDPLECRAHCAGSRREWCGNDPDERRAYPQARTLCSRETVKAVGLWAHLSAG